MPCQFAHHFAQCLMASAACIGFYFLTRQLLGQVVWVFLAVLVGVLFSRIVINAAAELGWQLRRMAIRPMEDQNYQFHGVPLRVIECEEHCRWILSDDIRRVLHHFPNDATLQRLFPVGFACMGERQRAYLRDDALLHYLSQAIRFKVWVDRNLAAPARKIRQRKGILVTTPYAVTDNTALIDDHTPASR